MNKFPSSKEEVNVWLTNLLNEEEEGKSAEAIREFVQQNDVDGKLLVLLYKHPNELPQLIPNLRARLLFMNALDVLIKNAGKDIPINLISAELPSESLLSRVPFSNDHSMPHFAVAGSSVDEKRVEDPDDSVSNMGEMSHSGGTTSHHHDQQLEGGDYGEEDSAAGEIPFPVPLPIFDHSLQQAIDAGRVRERCIRSRIANACARFYINFKMYPNQVDYHRICDRLIQKFPDLRDGELRLGVQPWRHLKKLLSMAFCNVRRIMKNKDLTNARHIISNIQKRYRGFGRETGRRIVPSARKQQNRSFSPLSSSSEETSSESNTSRNRTIPNPPPIPMFETDMQRAIVCCKLKERPYSTQFYRICAKFYTKLKKFPSRKDYKNISTHLAKVFPDLGPQSQVKHMLSQYIRSLRQSRKLLKLDRMQKARMLTMGMSGNKAYTSRHGYADPSTSNPNGSTAGQEYQFAVYEFPTSVAPREGQQSTLNPGFFSSFASDTSTPSTSSRPTAAPTSQNTTADSKSSASGTTNQSLFPLPPLDETMWKGIREGQLHDKTFRHKFIRHCAAFYISLKSYPTKEDYNMICRTVVTEFLDLRDPSPLPGCPPFMLFKKALTSCIRNKRRDLLSPVGNDCHQGGGGGRQPRRSRSSKSKSQRNSSNYNQNTQMVVFRDQPGLSVQTESSVATYDHLGRGRPQGAESGMYLQLGSAEPFDGGLSQQGHIPYPVPIPVFTTDLMMLLDTGQPIVADARNAFLQACAEFYLRMKLFLSKADFAAICAQLVQTFPQLADPGSVPGRMGFINLKKELSTHFAGYQQRIKSIPGPSKDIKNISGIIGGVNSLAVVPTSMPNNNPCPSGQQLLPFPTLPSHPHHHHHHHPPPAPHPASFDRRGTDQHTDIPITYPAPLPRFPRIIQQAIHQGYRLEGQARSRLLQVCAKFYTEIKYHPTRADYHNICTTLLEAIPVLGGLTVPADKSQDLRRVKKELSLHIRSLRRNCKVNGLPIPTSAPPIQWWYANATFPSVSAFNEYFNKTPTHEDVEKNITHLKEIINELA